MEFQSNPYLVWQIIPGFVLLGIGLYVRSRAIKKRETNVFSLLMFGAALWAFANAVQLLSPKFEWQAFWSHFKYAGIMIVPTAWCLLTVKLTGIFRTAFERVGWRIWLIPTFLYLLHLTNFIHGQFFHESELVFAGGYVSLEITYGPLFFLHTVYSYSVMVLGMAILAASIYSNFKRYGIQVYGLLMGALAPLLGNVYYLFGPLPVGFPDPTPIIFTVTGLAFAWAIFGGQILAVVPFAHDAIVRRLATGIIILDGERNVLDVNPAARVILRIFDPLASVEGLTELFKNRAEFMDSVSAALDDDSFEVHGRPVVLGDTNRTFDVLTSRVGGGKRIPGWIIQLSDVSEKRQAETNLEAAKQTLETVLDSLKEPYVEADPTGVITFANVAFYKQLGFSTRSEVVGHHFRHFTDRSSIRSVFQKYNEVIKSKQPSEMFRYDYLDRNGRGFIAETSINPIIVDGEVVGTRGIMRDITERVHAQEELLKAKRETEAHAEEMAAINRISMIVNQSLNLNDILQALCVELTRIFPIRNAGIGLLTAMKDHLEIVAFHAINSEEKSALGLILPFEGNTSSQEVIRAKKTLVVQDAQNDPRTASVADVSRARGTRAIMIVPLLTRGEAIGTIGMPARDPFHIFTPAEISLAETIASHIAVVIDNARLHAETERALNVAERDLEIGRQIQSGFFPEKLPDLPGWDISVQFDAARQVAGDFYDVFQFNHSKFTAFIIADVCDKGVGAALFMVLFRSLLRAFSRIHLDRETICSNLLEIVLNTNNFIADYHGKSNMFATLFFGVLDPDSGDLYYINGGHEPPMILDRNGQEAMRLLPTGPAVGLFRDMDFHVDQIHLREGDVLVGFTDGVTDAKNVAGEQFGEKRLLSAISAPWASTFSMVYELTAQLKRHIGGQSQFDDITLISLRRKLAVEQRVRHQIRRDARMDALGELREFIEAAAVQHGLVKDDVFSFKLVVDELCANIIGYGFEGREEPGWISLSFDADAEKARLIIRDNGMFFSPDQAKRPELEADWKEREIGGLGIYFVKELMDEVSYGRAEQNVNQFILEKNLLKSNTKKE